MSETAHYRWLQFTKEVATKNDKKYFPQLITPGPHWRFIVQMICFVGINYKNMYLNADLYGRVYKVWVNLYIDIIIKGLPTDVTVAKRLDEMRYECGGLFVIQEKYLKWMILYALGDVGLDPEYSVDGETLEMRYFYMMRYTSPGIKDFDDADEYSFDYLMLEVSKGAKLDINPEEVRDGVEFIVTKVKSLIGMGLKASEMLSTELFELPSKLLSQPVKPEVYEAQERLVSRVRSTELETLRRIDLYEKKILELKLPEGWQTYQLHPGGFTDREIERAVYASDIQEQILEFIEDNRKYIREQVQYYRDYIMENAGKFDDDEIQHMLYPDFDSNIDSFFDSLDAIVDYTGEKVGKVVRRTGGVAASGAGGLADGLTDGGKISFLPDLGIQGAGSSIGTSVANFFQTVTTGSLIIGGVGLVTVLLLKS